jgi:hypothetical protein
MQMENIVIALVIIGFVAWALSPNRAKIAVVVRKMVHPLHE